MIVNARKSAKLAATVVALCLSGTGAAAASPDAVLKAGETVAKSCAECHGSKGISNDPDIPHLAGQHAEFIVSSLKAYKDNTRAGVATQAMLNAVAPLSAEDIANVASYYGGLTPFTRRPVADGASDAAREAAQWDPLTAGRAAAEACAGCHGEDGNSEIPGMPSLAGQPRNYLLAAIRAYKDGSRAHDEMQIFTAELSQAELETLARYYAALYPKRSDAEGPGDAFAGRTASTACAGCHGEDGNTHDAATPRLAGLDPVYLADAVRAYAAGTRNHAVMQDLVTALDSTDIENLSAFYAAKEPKAAPGPKPLSVKQLAERCDRCHGAKGYSIDPRFPILAGQSRAYLVRSLKLYHGGQRDSPMMFAMSFPMGLTDIEHLAAYYAGQTAD